MVNVCFQLWFPLAGLRAPGSGFRLRVPAPGLMRALTPRTAATRAHTANARNEHEHPGKTYCF